MSEKLCLGCMEAYNEKYNVCPYCGYEESTPPKEAYHLVPGTTIKDKYIVGKVIGYGGFGVTYLGYDSVLNQRVAIKEYLPGEFATRATGASDVTIFSGEREEQFADGIVKFVDEARRLAKFRNTSGIVRIFDSFTANHTAYIVMEYLEGETLKDKLEREGKIPIDEALNLMMPIIKALGEVHKEGILHRDISPDNIFVTKYGEVKLLDFGAARYATTTHSKSLSVIVKPGYAPQEQYRSRGDQGTWTDVYACAATLYKMITGVTPEDSMERGNKDTLVPPSKLGVKIPKNKENAIMNALNLRIEDRTQTAEAFEADLSTENDVKRNKIRFKKMDVGKWPLWLKISSGVASTAIAAFIVLLLTGVIQFADLFHSDSGELEKGYVYAPEVRNMELEKAETIISERNLITQIVDKKNDDEIPKDFILSQNIPTGEVIQERTVIEITVSAGKEIEYLTDIMGLSQEEAVELLKALGFDIEVIEEASDEIAPGYITRQTDEEGNILENGAGLEKGSKIFIYVSTGNDKFDENKNTAVPNVVGKSYNDAARSMTNAKLYIYKAGSDYSNTVPEGHVISQNTKAGTEVSEGTKIGVIISLGKQSERKTRVPDVTYKSKQEAERLLSDAGLAVTVQYEDSNTVAKDGVIRQSEAAGTEVVYGTTIIIYVSKGNPEVKPSEPISSESTTQEPTTTEKPTTAEEPINPEPQKPDKKDVLVKSISLNETSVTLAINNPFNLYATVLPSDATNQGVSWSSSNSSVATVNADGVVTAVSPGTVTITVKALDGSGVKASCNVTVTDPDAGKVKMPNIVGKTEAQAKTALQDAGLVGNITYKSSAGSSSGTVLEQGISANKRVDKGTSVSIVVCNNEQKTEYLYSTRTKTGTEITTQESDFTTAPSLSGWSYTGYYEIIETWGNWSGWSDTVYTSSSTRKVETQQVQTVAAKTVYKYLAYYCNGCGWRQPCNHSNNGYGGGCANCGRKGTLEYLTKESETQLAVRSNGAGWGCGTAGCINGTFTSYQDSNGWAWYFCGTGTKPAQYKTQYRYKDAKITYRYQYDRATYSAWTQQAWSTSQMTEGETVRLDNTRQVYVYPEY
ncbi:MAG: PASTA domain-containing protein [Clostridium sp.]|nr:PASTA domain-containing protein [Clostridium sp.]MCM1171270.1 PASTA domain-containing protein [Clostridium sp.]MCM1207460.1 PASTA domain-containing protein [Ruminococcus sp.]